MKKIINNIIEILMLLINIVFVYYLIKLNIVPTLYLVIIIGIIVILNIASWILLSKGKIALIFGYILLAINLIISCVGIYYTSVTDSFFSSLEEVNEEQLYYVVVKKDSEYNKLKDLNNKKMAIFENQSNNYKKVLNEVKDSIKVKDKKYTNVNTIVKDLLDGNVDSLLINSNNKILLDENVKSFKDNTKVIAKLSIKLSKQEDKKEDSEEKSEEVINNGSFNVLISGIDTYGSINRVSRSDVNIVVTVNPNTHKILLTSIQRDMYVQLHGTTGTRDKLTHAGIYGINMSRQTIEDFLDIDIPYYVRVNFDSVIKLVDTIGGVDIYNDVAFRGSRYFEQGNIHLNGEQALEYARERKKMPNGDWTRGEHQKVIITAIINKIANSKELLTNYGDILNNSKDLIQTNITTDVIKKFVKDQIDSMSPWNITSTFVGGAGSDYRETYSMPGMNLYITYPDENSVKNVSKQINDLLNEK